LLQFWVVCKFVNTVIFFVNRNNLLRKHKRLVVVNRQKPNNQGKVVVRRGGRPVQVSNFPLTPQPGTIYVLVSPNCQIPQPYYYGYNQPVIFVQPQYIQPHVQPHVQRAHVVYQAPLPVHQLQQVAQPYNPQPGRTEVPIRNLSEKPILENKGEGKKECTDCNNGSESDEESESGSDSEISSDLELDSDIESDRESLSKLKAVALSIAEKNYHKQICEDFVIAIQLEEVLEDSVPTIPKTTTTTADEWEDDWKENNNYGTSAKKYDEKEWSCQLQIAKEDIISLYQMGEDVSGLINVYLGEHPQEADSFTKLLEDAVSSYSIMFNVKTYTPKKPDHEEIFEIDYLEDSYDSDDNLSDDGDECTDMNYLDEQELVSVNT